MIGPSNPLFKDQWHFDLIGDIQSVWKTYSGQGVKVAVYDQGTQRSHPDLNDNYNGSNHFRSTFGSDDGQPIGSSDAHGTAVAGIIAAEDNNIGGVGIAFDAQLTGVNFLKNIPTFDARANFEAIRYMEAFDVVNNSWGYTPTYESYLNLGSRLSVAFREGQAMEFAARNGRDGLGTIIVKSAGNDVGNPSLENDGILGNTQGEGHSSLHVVIPVAATDASGMVQEYSNWGSNLLVAAPAASVTTDLTGRSGYASGDYDRLFGGTSAAAPVVSGVVTLMLQANSDLGWRDVQKILALTAQETGSGYESAPRANEQSSWLTNGAENWNGGGMKYSLSYGFGMVDAYAAVRMAEIWSSLSPEAQTSANDISHRVTYSGRPENIKDFQTTEIEFNITRDISVEHIYVTLSGTHSKASNLIMWLRAPTGERYQLFRQELDKAPLAQSWKFGVTGAMGTDARGTWTLEIEDKVRSNTGRFNSAKLEIIGGADSVDTLHHITTAYADLRDSEASRRIISDTDGGIDWLNFVTIAENVTASLADQGQFGWGGRELGQLAQGTVIERIASGDGDDKLTGNTLSNRLYSGRGDDSVRGGTGNDLIKGQADNDTLVGDGGNDTLMGEDGNDRLSGGRGNDLLRGDAGNDTLFGGDGNDLLRGGEGENALYGGGGNDRIYGGNAADTLSGASGNDRLIGGDGNDNMRGGTGNDVLYGLGGNDTMIGDPGTDRLSGGDGADLILGWQDNDTLSGGADNDRLYGGRGNDLLLGQDGDDMLAGGSNNDRLYGGDGADKIIGGPGSDSLNGGAQADTFVFNSVSESRHGSSRDTIVDFEFGLDKIDLSGVMPGLSFVSSYTGTAGEVRYNGTLANGTKGRLYVDIDGDRASDLSINILLDGPNAPNLSVSDLIL